MMYICAMKRLVVELRPDEHIWLKTQAALEGRSVAALVRGWIGERMDEKPRFDPKTYDDIESADMDRPEKPSRKPAQRIDLSKTAQAKGKMGR